MQAITRRQLLQLAATTSLAAGISRMSFAKSNSDARFVLVILRGALDGLAAVPSYGDGNYSRVRGELALPSPGNTDGILKLDGMFGLNPALSSLHQRYVEKELIAFHAVASPYRERSHFDGQDLLENGTTTPHGSQEGWLNRLLSQLHDPHINTEKYAIAFAQNIPLVLRGANQVGSWAPSRLPETDSETLQRLADMYANDAYFTNRLQAAMAIDAVANGSMEADQMAMQNKPTGSMPQDATSNTPRADSVAAIRTLMAAAARMLKADDGPRIAVVEATGWDTHANQGAERGTLATRLKGLDAAIESVRVELGNVWQQTALLVVTEFGRTVAINGTRGTDHGTGTCALLVGGAVQGGRVVTDWPGLSANNLYQNRDLKPTLDLRSVFKGIAIEQLGVSESQLEQTVFPDSRDAKPISGLIRHA
jgi:uncharacterized protein (DUF1501 family)